ncbi:hypothetical protein [Bacillus haynesii]|uniref:hypothetical protein n=1 Tax=Bacillus haynesii TaxID=1925021 RepID=UPI00227DFB2E|nr:hypothetical protein [Bacillus haynesii]MCY8554933.1 hypothetical protein [Bacillus haynesii]
MKIKNVYHRVLNRLINGNGTWDKEQLQFSNIDFLTLRHGKKNFEHRANILFEKIN